MKNWLKRPIAVGIYASIAAALLISGVQYLLSRFIEDSILSAFFSAAAALSIVVISIQLQLINPLRLLGARYLDKYTGINQVYPSLEESFDDLKTSFAKAKRIDLLLHIGRQEFGIKEALFTDILERRVSEQADLEVRILHIGEDSPYLSDARAKALGKRRDKWIKDVQYVRERIVQASGGAPNVQIHLHSEPFVWRLFIFDDTMYVSGYLHTTKNDKKAPVYRIREGDSSLYPAFRNYYNHLWALHTDELRSDRHAT